MKIGPPECLFSYLLHFFKASAETALLLPSLQWPLLASAGEAICPRHGAKNEKEGRRKEEGGRPRGVCLKATTEKGASSCCGMIAKRGQPLSFSTFFAALILHLALSTPAAAGNYLSLGAGVVVRRRVATFLTPVICFPFFCRDAVFPLSFLPPSFSLNSSPSSSPFKKGKSQQSLEWMAQREK